MESAKAELSKKEQEIAKLKGDVVSSQKDSELSVQQLKEKYEFMLKAKDEEIEKYKNFRMGDSTKDLGESLEQYCHDAFDEIRAALSYFIRWERFCDGHMASMIENGYLLRWLKRYKNLIQKEA